MTPGRTSVYLTERLANLLEAHGPAGLENERNLAEKLGYLLTGWDRLLRDEAARWRELLSRAEWDAVVAATWSHAFAMDVGGSAEQDLGAVLLCVEDAEEGEIEAAGIPNPRKTLDSLASKLQLRGYSTAGQLALVWMILRERKRRGDHG